MTRFASCLWVPADDPSAGQVTGHHGLVIHRRGGVSGSGSFWFCTPSDDIHATFSVGLDGTAVQHIDDDNHTVLLGMGGQCYALAEVAGTGALSPPQVDGLAAIYAEGHRRYGWPLTVARAPGEAGLLGHGSGGLSYAAHADCPGRDLISSLDAVLARVHALLDAAANGTASPGGVAGEAIADTDAVDAASAPAANASPEPDLIKVAPQPRPPRAAPTGWGRRWLPS
jgi:hypothetical protein